MRTSATLLALAAAVTLSASAFAAPAITPDAGSSAMVPAQTIEGHRTLRDAAAGITGTYGLSDGQTLRVSFERRKLFAEVDERKVEIVQAGHNTFVSRSGNLKLVFDQLPIANVVALARN